MKNENQNENEIRGVEWRNKWGIAFVEWKGKIDKNSTVTERDGRRDCKGSGCKKWREKRVHGLTLHWRLSK